MAEKDSYYFKILKEKLGNFQDWKYVGGDNNRHKKYAKLCNVEIQPHVDYCVCSHKIKENCYIKKICPENNNDEIVVLGNCCIKKFIPKSGRTCDICTEPHKNRVVNRCNKCRIGRCDICDNDCSEVYKKCYKCHLV